MDFSKIKNLGIWGDSILKGVIFDEEKGKYKTLKQCAISLFGKKFNLSIKNNSRFGCTAPKAMENMKSTLNKGYSPDMVLLEFGGNDSDFNWAEISKNPDGVYKSNTPIDEFYSTMEKMVDLLISKKIQPVLMNLPPIDSQRYFKWITKFDGVDGDKILHWLSQVDAIYRYQEMYSRAIDKLAYKKNLILIDIRSKFLEIKNYKDYLCIDGIHPNQKGQALINDICSNYVLAYT